MQGAHGSAHAHLHLFLLTTRSLFSAGKSLRRRTYGKSSNSSFHSYSYVRVYVRASLSLSFLCVRERERDGQETEILCAVGLTLRHMKTIMDYYCILYIYMDQGGGPASLI
jgi:hypothetical protein